MRRVSFAALVALALAGCTTQLGASASQTPDPFRATAPPPVELAVVAAAPTPSPTPVPAVAAAGPNLLPPWTPPFDPDEVPGADAWAPPSADAPVETPGPAPTAEPEVAAAPSCADPPPDAAAARVVSAGSRSTKLVALTFDDGWNAPNTLRIIRILQAARANATFFPTGWALEDFPGTWRTVAAAGFPIGDHTYDHATLAGRCYGSQLAAMTRQHDAVLRATGLAATPLLRPPGGAYDWTTRLAANAAAEQAVVIWDVDSRDWSGISTDTIVARALAGREGSIILMHTFPVNTAAALPSIIAGFRNRGFGFATVGQLVGVDGPVPYG